MNDCNDTQSLLVSYIDEELDVRTIEAVDSHLAECTSCRGELDELQRVRALSRSHWDAVVQAAPAPTSEVQRLAEQWAPVAGFRLRILSRGSRIAAGLLVAIALGWVLLFGTTSRLEASPLQLLQEASSRFLSCRNVEFVITPEAPMLTLLTDLSGTPDDDGYELSHFRVLLDASGRFLVSPDATQGPWQATDELRGFDGESSWIYDAERERVDVTTGAEPVDSIRVTAASAPNLRTTLTIDFQLLYWDYFASLRDADYEISERTDDMARERGQRVFELRPKAGDPTSFVDALTWERSEVTVDAQDGLIEHYELDVRFGGLGVYILRTDVARVDQELPAGFFEHTTHLPVGTQVHTKR